MTRLQYHGPHMTQQQYEERSEEIRLLNNFLNWLRRDKGILFTDGNQPIWGSNQHFINAYYGEKRLYG